jgi:hypothetical protein
LSARALPSAAHTNATVAQTLTSWELYRYLRMDCY